MDGLDFVSHYPLSKFFVDYGKIDGDVPQANLIVPTHLGSARFTILSSFSLKDASSETLLSSDLAPSSKDTIGKSSNTSVNRFDSYVLYGTAANSDEAENQRLSFLSLLIWIIGVSLVIFFISDVSRAFKGPLLT
ncbi:hypothetical protein L6164_001351 [Bauhinia variegata]|uniref:Uncharacterized protein n=1 Tax=Bauhinia variegata TaxID=167791 RepID=A0ACB9Q9I6_BAUVA|nr:hypothetical protein L6164_001351 [Bauhinia variegata]